MASFVTVLQALAAHADVAPALVAANRQICGDAAIFYQLRTLEFLTQSPAECDAAVAALQQLDLLGRGNAHLRLAALRLWRGHRHADLQAVGDGIDSLGIPLHHDRDYLQALRFLLAHDRDATALCRAAVQRSDAGDSASRVLALVS